MQGCMTVRDLHGGKAKTFNIAIGGGQDVSKMAALATAVKVWTDGEIVDVSCTESYTRTNPTAATVGPYALASYKAFITFRNLNASSYGSKYLMVKIPCPIETMFEQDLEGKRLVVTKAAGDALATAIGTAAGMSLEFDHGILWSKPKRRK